MEPSVPAGRHNRMLADTSAIHAFGAAHARHASDLEEITTRLAATGAQIGTDALGPVGARFVAALTEALAAEAHTLARIATRMAVAAGTARTSADAYDDTDTDAGRAISGVER
jgi:hypothetical protein